MKDINKNDFISSNNELKNIEIINNQITNLYKEIKDLNLKLNKKEDDIKNIIAEKDNTIKEIQKKLIIQENLITKNNNKIKQLNKKINEIDNKFITQINDKENKINKNKEEINNINNNLLKEIDNKYNELKKINNDLNDKLINHEYKIENKLNKNILPGSYKYEALSNGFILFGGTGAGKTTLLNVLFGKEIGKVERSRNPVTKESKVYYYKLKNDKNISIIDTPGLNVINDQMNQINIKRIKELITKEKMQFKGLLFLVNFQNERFDASDQQALLTLNQIFPYKTFWKHILIVFTHYFADPDGDDEEEMIAERNKINGEIIQNLMYKVKSVSDIINYNEIKIKYLNSYWPIKNDRQKKANENVKNELEKELEKFIIMNPLC